MRQDPPTNHYRTPSRPSPRIATKSARANVPSAASDATGDVLALSGAGEEALVAEAHIASDRLRDCGRLQGLTPGTRLSGVVALPLCAPGDAQQPLPKLSLIHI